MQSVVYMRYKIKSRKKKQINQVIQNNKVQSYKGHDNPCQNKYLNNLKTIISMKIYLKEKNQRKTKSIARMD